MKTHLAIIGITAILSFAVGLALADDFDVDWWTIDGGGYMFSAGGSFELSGTIGQPDAGPVAMTGGAFELTGGFWAVPPCWCIGDLNGDGLRDGADIQRFVDCVLGGDSDCACADVENDGVLDALDVTTFVSGLLEGENCP